MKPFISVSCIASHKCWSILLGICIPFPFGGKENYFVNNPSVTYAHPLLIIDWKKPWHSKGSSKCAIYWKMLFIDTLILYKLCMCSTWTTYDCIKLNANELSWAGAHWENWHLKHEPISGALSWTAFPGPALSMEMAIMMASFSRFRSKS